MSLTAWLRSGKQHGSPRSRTTFRPTLEALEDRSVPSTLKVTNLNDSGPGSLRYEIAQAQNNDTIVFDKKLDGGTLTLWSGEELSIGKNLTIQGPGAGLMTITSESYSTGSSRIFEVFRGNVILSGLTIKNGGGQAYGHGYSDAYDGLGGAVLNLGGTLTITNCILSGNVAPNGPGGAGGAIYNTGSLTVSGCNLTNNSTSSGWGGGIYNAGTMTVSGCTLSNNFTTLGYGGGIYNAGTATVSGCTLSGNSAYSGGGIANFGTMTVNACNVSGNTANPATGTNDGSAVASGGGGIYNAGYNGGALTVSNSTFSANTPDNIAGPYTDGGGNSFK